MPPGNCWLVARDAGGQGQVVSAGSLRTASGMALEEWHCAPGSLSFPLFSVNPFTQRAK